ncbi:MAG TPA: FIST N-terminal domain-containing protein [Longimicrobiales bacterium]|nr:FIST N-terminal domain-containing protein [Longimicrobiales bacterium]
MPIRVAQSTNPDPRAAAAELKAGLGAGEWQLVLYFVSSAYPQAETAAAVQRAFAPARTLGCSTAGEIVSGAMATSSIVAMALDAEPLADFDLQLVADIHDRAAIDAALARLEEHFGASLRRMDVDRYVGLALMDGLSGAEERLMDYLGDRTDVLFVGGSAGDDLAFRETTVHADGRTSARGAVLAILRPRNGFDIIKTQSFTEFGRTLVPTAVDEATRTVREFDGRPAVQAYAEALGASPEALADEFMSHPLGLMVDGEPFVRSPQQVSGGAIRFFCAVKEGMELSILTSADIVRDTERALAERLSGAAGLVNFNCILRTLELRKKGLDEAYGRLFERVPTIGFSTYGEAYLGHVNQTATMLLLR